VIQGEAPGGGYRRHPRIEGVGAGGVWPLTRAPFNFFRFPVPRPIRANLPKGVPMKRFVVGVLALALTAPILAPVPAAAQSGFGLKAHLVYNASTAQTFRDEPDSSLGSDFAGFNLGAEYMLPMGLGLGLTGTASGDPRDTDRATVFMVLAEANYYLDIPVLPVRPFLGAHIGLGSWSWDVRDELVGEDGFSDLERAKLGWQLGVRVGLPGPLSIEAMYRRMSASAKQAQDPGFEADQVLLGVRLF
jgi:opacity protein-like surface antigen